MDHSVNGQLEDAVLTIRSFPFLRVARRALCGPAAQVHRKELGKEARCSIIMEQGGTSPYTVKLPTSHNAAAQSVVQMPMDGAGPSRILCDSGPQEAQHRLQLNPKYSFENFVRERATFGAQCWICCGPEAVAFNPLLIYSPVGLGKTHLAHAIGIEIKNRFRRRRSSTSTRKSSRTSSSTR